jgi:hypothetical protein
MKTTLGALALILPLGLAGCAYQDPYYGYGGGSYYSQGSSYYPSGNYYAPGYAQGYYSPGYSYGNEYWIWSERDRRYYRRDRDHDPDGRDRDHDHDRDRNWVNRHDRDGDGVPDWRDRDRGNRGNWNRDRDNDGRRDWARQQQRSPSPQYAPPPSGSVSGRETQQILRENLREQGLKVPPRH